MRKGALNEAALKLGCNKIAYAHHRDDLIETMLLSLIYEEAFLFLLAKNPFGQNGIDADPHADVCPGSRCDRI